MDIEAYAIILECIFVLDVVFVSLFAHTQLGWIDCVYCQPGTAELGLSGGLNHDLLHRLTCQVPTGPTRSMAQKS